MRLQPLMGPSEVSGRLGPVRRATSVSLAFSPSGVSWRANVFACLCFHLPGFVCLLPSCFVLLLFDRCARLSLLADFYLGQHRSWSEVEIRFGVSSGRRL